MGAIFSFGETLMGVKVRSRDSTIMNRHKPENPNLCGDFCYQPIRDPITHDSDMSEMVSGLFHLEIHSFI